jgi:hypothetical protein
MSDSSNSLRSLNEVAPIDTLDVDCMNEIRQVLVKYNKADRFGLTLLHKHFDLKDDEVLMERSDANTRTLISAVVARSDVPPDAVDTWWSLSSAVPIALGKCRSQWHEEV